MKQIMQMTIIWLKITTGRRQTRWPFTNVAKELNLGLLRNNSRLVVRAGLAPVTSGIQVRRPNHLATLSPVPPKCIPALLLTQEVPSPCSE